ncbi:hypothetical protein INR49_018701, partial [Caranx melampygus]
MVLETNELEYRISITISILAVPAKVSYFRTLQAFFPPSSRCHCSSTTSQGSGRIAMHRGTQTPAGVQVLLFVLDFLDVIFQIIGRRAGGTDRGNSQYD